MSSVQQKYNHWTPEQLEAAALDEATWIHIMYRLKVPANPMLFMWVEKLLLEERESRLSGDNWQE
jgi:hypothetical protein